MSIPDSEEAPGHVYTAELDGASVVVHNYKKTKSGLREFIKTVDSPAFFDHHLFYTTALINTCCMGCHSLLVASFLPSLLPSAYQGTHAAPQVLGFDILQAQCSLFELLSGSQVILAADSLLTFGYVVKLVPLR
jgi:hypothetical protein